MEALQFNLSQSGNQFKRLNATGGGPLHKRHASDQYRSNFEDYKAARIPYSRNHDCGVITTYGGPYSHDISNIFPNFDADPTLPESYEFACTDEDILMCLDAGTKTFFRLGQTIEHQIKKYNILPPKDYKRWAVICEHIIRHYTEGWAGGYTLDMPYWEIWNEPDLDPDEAVNRRTWGGTKAQFFDFYEVVAKHLKSCFPHLKIGGPALAFNTTWADEFLGEMRKRNVELDFFSWHIYCTEPWKVTMKAETIHDLLVKHGYNNTESILNEWNYIRDWHDFFKYSLKSIHGLKGASFITGCICEAQQTFIDMLMYYDTRPSAFNGIFDYYTWDKLKGYYPMYWYGKFYGFEKEIPSENRIENIYSICGVDKDGKAMAMVTYYNDDDDSPAKEISIDFGKPGKYQVYLLDETHDGELFATTDKPDFTMTIYSTLLIQEI